MLSPSQDSVDRQMMMRAIRLAEKGLFTASPNPRVGCVITKNNEILAQGWHKKTGEAHAEVNALGQLKDPALAKGATVYVSLEPCSHTGKTGPCSQALIEAGVARVVCGMTDPSPKVSGEGIKKLQTAGIEVQSAFLEKEAQALNPGFIKRMKKNQPYVRLKMAMSIDGKIALGNGNSKWISNEHSRKDVHYWRARSDAILTGSDTVLADNPQMTARHDSIHDLKQPLRCVIDSADKVKRSANIFSGGRAIKIGATENSDWQLPLGKNAKVDLSALLEKFSQEEINELWVEAGAGLAGAFIEQHLADELLIYMAPVILGDKARSLFDLPLLEEMKHKKTMTLVDVRHFSEDIRLRYRFVE